MRDHWIVEDARAAIIETTSIAMKAGEFIRNPDNFAIIGFYPELQKQEATLLFCDLTASAKLFRVLDPPSAITCLDEYLARQAEVVVQHGGAIDQYLGDGAMFRFDANLRRRDYDHTVQAAEAALKMRRNFELLKESWMATGWELSPLFNRIGLACGDVYELPLGHPTKREIVVMGETVNRAAHLCDLGIRDRSIILVDQAAHDKLAEHFLIRPATIQSSSKAQQSAYELVSSTPETR